MAEFRRHYPDGVWFSPAQYSTRDGIIPFQLFWAYYGAIGANRARERLDQFRAIAIALACAFSKKDDGLLPVLQDELVAAQLAPPDPAEGRLSGAQAH